MPLREADLSATPIDDGSLIPDDGASRPQRNPNAPSNRPMSPQPKLVLFDPKSGEQETIELGSASSIMTLEDYKRLNRRTTERGMITGILGGGALTYAIKRFMPKSRTPSRNALSLTFLFSSAFISFSTSRGLLISEILRIRAQARAQALANGSADLGDAPPSDKMFGEFGSGESAFPGGTGVGTRPGFGTGPGMSSRNGYGSATGSGSSSGFSLDDLRSPEDEARRQTPSGPGGGYVPPGYRRNPPETSDVVGRSGPGYGSGRDVNSDYRAENGVGAGGRGGVRDELSRIGTQVPQRTRWAKGKGLEGEVEEEGEMRDPYNTPGNPRN